MRRLETGPRSKTNRDPGINRARIDLGTKTVIPSLSFARPVQLADRKVDGPYDGSRHERLADHRDGHEQGRGVRMPAVQVSADENRRHIVGIAQVASDVEPTRASAQAHVDEGEVRALVGRERLGLGRIEGNAYDTVPCLRDDLLQVQSDQRFIFYD